jgi:predicted DNA-binding protein with PD1-like motif
MEHRPTKPGTRLLVRLDRGEEVLASLAALCSEQGIACASLTGIGAVRDAELGYYDLESFTYATRSVPEVCELVSLVGNVALVDGAPFVHAHATLGDRELRLVGGHLVRATVAVTAEIFLDVHEGELERALDPEVRLKLLRP